MTEIPDRWETSDIPGLPSGFQVTRAPKKVTRATTTKNDHALYQTKGSYYLDGISIDLLRHLVVNDTVHEQARERERERDTERER